MAETTIIDISVQKTIDQVVLLKKSIQDLSAAQDTLNAEVKEGEQLSEEQAKQMEVLNAAVRNQKKEVTALTRLIDNSVKQRKAEVGSIEANRAELARLTAEIQKAAVPEKEQIKRALQLSDRLKEQEAAYGDTRRNVGNYASALSGAGGILKQFGVDTSGLEQKLKSAREALVETRKRLIDIQGNLGGASGATDGFVKGLLNTTKALFTTKTGLITLAKAAAATGIGALVVVIGLLLAGLVKLEPIANRLAGAFAALSAAYDAVVGATFQFIQGIKNGEGVLNSFSKSFTGLADNMSEAAKEAYNLVQQLDALEDAQRRQNLVNAQAEAQVKNLIIQSKDRTLTESQRLAFLEEAAAIEKKAFEQQLELAKEAERLAQIAFDRSVKNGVADDELEQALIDKQVARIQLESQSADLQEKIDNRKNALLDEQIQKQEKADEKAAASKEKQRLADEKALKDKEDYYKLLDELQDEFETDERSKIEDSFNEKLALIKGNSEKEIKLREDIERAKENALKEFDNKLKNDEFVREQEFLSKKLELDLAAIDLSADAEKVKADKKFQIQLEALERQLELTEKFIGADGLVTESELQGIQEIENAILRLRQTVSNVDETVTLGDSLGLDEESIQKAVESSEVIESVVSGIQEIANLASQAKIQNIEREQEAEIEAVNNSVGTQEEKAKAIQAINQKAAKEKYEAELAAFKASKATSIILTIINTAQAVMAQLGNPVPFAGIALAALAAATGAAQIAVIASQKPPAPPAKFAEGGSIDIEGASHSQGGAQIAIDGQPVAVAEGGEKLFVMKKSASAEIEKLSQWNQLFGGRSWTHKTRHAADGGQLFDGGFAARSFATNVNNQVVISELITASLKSMPTPEVKVTEINRVQRGVQQTVEVSSL